MSQTLIADMVLLIHALFVAFVVGGQVLILAGWAGVRLSGQRARGRWTRNLRFRKLHLGAIAAVVAIDLAGFLCPLTAWEAALRQNAGQPGPGDSFIAHWVGRLLYYDGPGWAFTIVYVGFGLLVAAAYIFHPPARGD